MGTSRKRTQASSRGGPSGASGSPVYVRLTTRGISRPVTPMSKGGHSHRGPGHRAARRRAGRGSGAGGSEQEGAGRTTSTVLEYLGRQAGKGPPIAGAPRAGRPGGEPASAVRRKCRLAETRWRAGSNRRAATIGLAQHLAPLDHRSPAVSPGKADEAKVSLRLHVHHLDQVGGIAPNRESLDGVVAGLYCREPDRAPQRDLSDRTSRCRYRLLHVSRRNGDHVQDILFLAAIA